MNTLAEIGAGFEQPVHAAQQTFRTLLEATARPGRVFTLPEAAREGVQPPRWGTGGMGAATTALLLTLLDADTRLHLGAGEGSASSFFGFHTGVRGSTAAEADFVVLPAARAEAGVWSTLAHGSDEAPQSGATLIIEVPRLTEGPGTLRLRGPGIEREHLLRVEGPSAAFWQARIACEPLFPRGIDLVLCCGPALAAIPRSTHLTLEF